MAVTSYQVAGSTVTMPCVVRDASAGTVTFDVDAAGARPLVPDAFELVETSPGRCNLTLAVIDYRDNDLGSYHEVGVTFFVRPARPAPPSRPDGVGDDRDDRDDEAGTYIHSLPVDEEFTCEAGRRIWGFPKSIQDIAFGYADTSVTVTLRMDGRPALRLTLPRGGEDEMPPLPLTTYTVIDGVPHATAFSQGGPGSQVVAGSEGVAIELGDHPLGATLAGLGLATSDPLFTTWTEHLAARFDAPRPLP